MKKLIALSTLLAVSSVALAQGGFQDPNNPQAAEKPRHEMKHDHKGKKHDGREGGFFDESKVVKTVAALKDAQDDSIVMLEGKIIKQVGKDDFLFKDATGEIEIEVSKKAWKGQTITPNDTIEIRGKVDKEWDKTEVEVKKITKK